jgi:DNA-directed RNA polymerase subunit RPC12/RpoP
MSIEVIRQGKKPGDRLCRGICNNCGTEVKHLVSDGKYQSCQRDGEWVVVKCPTCGKDIYSGIQS